MFNLVCVTSSRMLTAGDLMATGVIVVVYFLVCRYVYRGTPLEQRSGPQGRQAPLDLLLEEHKQEVLEHRWFTSV